MTESHVVYLTRAFETQSENASNPQRDSQSPYTPVLLHLKEDEDYKQIMYKIAEDKIAIFTYMDGMRTATIIPRRELYVHDSSEVPMSSL